MGEQTAQDRRCVQIDSCGYMDVDRYMDVAGWMYVCRWCTQEDERLAADIVEPAAEDRRYIHKGRGGGRETERE